MTLRKRIRTLPRDDRTCGWTETLPPLPPPRRLEGSVRADCAIIGAGFTGLAIARRLAQLRPDWRIVLVDAQRIGDGTSGRSSGFVVDLTDVAAHMGNENRDRYVRLARSGIDQLRTLVREHDIDCDWDETGWIRGARGEKGRFFLDRLPPIYDELGMEYQPLDAEAMAAITGSRFYNAGIRLLGYPLIHTGKLVRGLAGCLPENIELYEESPVVTLEVGASAELVTESGSATADRLFLATNGYTPALGFLQRRVFPLYTFGSLTRVLTGEEQEILGGEREWGILAMDPMGSSVRRTRDQRLLIRNTSHYSKKLRISEQCLREIKKEHRKAYLARFPMLEQVDFAHTWSGLMGTAKNSQISFLRLHENLFAAAGFTAAGIAMGATAGKLLADWALGEESEMVCDMRALPSPTLMPPDPFRSIGGILINARMNAQAGDCL